MPSAVSASPPSPGGALSSGVVTGLTASAWLAPLQVTHGRCPMCRRNAERRTLSIGARSSRGGCALLALAAAGSGAVAAADRDRTQQLVDNEATRRRSADRAAAVQARQRETLRRDREEQEQREHADQVRQKYRQEREARKRRRADPAGEPTASRSVKAAGGRREAQPRMN